MYTLFQLLVPASLFFIAPSSDAPTRARANKAAPLTLLDTDASGTLSAEEMAGTEMGKYFSRIDTNGDGELSRKELMTARLARKAKKDRDHRARMKQQFNARDTDDSNSLSADELADTKMEKHFSKLDTDRNGEITPDEMRGHGRLRAAKAKREAHSKRQKKAMQRAEKNDMRSRKKAENGARKTRDQAVENDKRGGKKSFANAPKTKDRKRFAQRGRKNAT